MGKHDITNDMEDLYILAECHLSPHRKYFFDELFYIIGAGISFSKNFYDIYVTYHVIDPAYINSSEIP